jgi:hypothetical protein
VYKQRLTTIPQIKTATVTVGPDKVHGMRATIRIQLDDGTDAQAVEQEIDRVLGVFTVTFDLDMVR